MRRILLALATIALATSIQPASAHTTLERANPAVGSIIQKWPAHFTLTFGEPLEIIRGQEINFVSVHNANGDDLTGPTPQVSSTEITVPVKSDVVPGLVLVNYRVVAADGHVLEGEYTFSFQSAGGASTVPVTHHSNKNTAVYSATTVLIVFSLLAGVWIYRRRKP